MSDQKHNRTQPVKSPNWQFLVEKLAEGNEAVNAFFGHATLHVEPTTGQQVIIMGATRDAIMEFARTCLRDHDPKPEWVYPMAMIHQKHVKLADEEL